MGFSETKPTVICNRFNAVVNCFVFFLSEAPTILTEVTELDPIMQRDVFGPVLPVLTVNNLDDAIAFINKQEKPLCVYAYSSNSKVPERLMLRHYVFIVPVRCS